MDAEVSQALQDLFVVFDVDGNGTMDLFEFVETTSTLARARGLEPDSQEAMQMFVEMNAGGGGLAGGLSFEDFADWQVKHWLASGHNQNDMASACRMYAAEISSARAALENATISPDGATTDVAEAAAVAASASESLALAAGRAAAAIRQQRHARQGGGGTGGGGHCTLGQGFVESSKDVTLDMDEFDKGFDEQSSSDDQQEEITELVLEGVDLEILTLAKTMRSNVRKCLRRVQEEVNLLVSPRRSPSKRSISKQRVIHGIMLPEEVRERNADLKSQQSEFWRQRQHARTGKLTVQGVVRHRATRMRKASVHLRGLGHQLKIVEAGKQGTFEHSMSASLGRTLTLMARKSGFAHGSRSCSGEGVRQVYMELLPLSVTGRFKAEPGSVDIASFEDSASSTIFRLPTGDLVKDNVPFEGEAEFEAAVVDMSSREGIIAMPPLIGRTVSGARVPLQSMGAVFTGLKDVADGKDLSLKSGSFIDVALPSRAALSRVPPSVWNFHEARGEWEQSMQPLMVNGCELLPLDPQAEVREARSKDSVMQEPLQLGKELDAAATVVQEGRQALDAQRREESERKICTCGFGGKSKIIPLIQEVYGLKKSDPPKRVFAATVPDGHGGVCLEFPYLTVTQIEASAKLASSHRQVVLSHHLISARDLFDSVDNAERGKPQSKLKWRQVVKKAAPHLQHVVAWLLDGAHAVNVESGEPVHDIDPAVYQLRVLEQLVNMWVQPRLRNSTASTTHELREALSARSGDIVGALLDVGQAQIRRDEVALVRQLLKNYDPVATARYRDVESALQAASGDADAAAKALSEDPAVRLRAKKFYVRERLQSVMPAVYPSSRLVEQAIDQAEEERRELEAKADLAKAESANVAEKLTMATAAREAAEKAVSEASARGDFRATEAAERDLRMTTRAEAQAKDNAAEVAALADEAVDAASEAAIPANAFGMASTALALIIEEQEVQQVQKSWTQIMQAAGDQNMFNFEITNIGWTNVNAPEQNVETEKVSEASPRPAPPVATQEFFPPPPAVVCPLRESSLVLGAFDDSICATTAMACSINHSAITYTEEVQPDGTFSLVTLANSSFDLRTVKPDGSTSLSFGPFRAKGPNEVTYVGLLEPPRSDEIKWEPSDLKSYSLVPSTVEIVLPRLEFPAHAAVARHDPEEEEKSVERDDTETDSPPTQKVREERCTCFEGYAEEELDFDHC